MSDRTPARTRPERFAARSVLSNFGVSLDPADFGSLVAGEFEARYKSLGTAAELLLRPREALRFCDAIRDALADAGQEHAFDVPDDAILRILRRRDRFTRAEWEAERC